MWPGFVAASSAASNAAMFFLKVASFALSFEKRLLASIKAAM